MNLSKLVMYLSKQEVYLSVLSKLYTHHIHLGCPCGPESRPLPKEGHDAPRIANNVLREPLDIDSTHTILTNTQILSRRVLEIT